MEPENMLLKNCRQIAGENLSTSLPMIEKQTDSFKDHRTVPLAASPLTSGKRD